jgi:hypothetical protein
MHVCEILYDKPFRSTFGFQRGRVHYWISKVESTFKMYLFTLSPVLKGKGVGGVGLLHYTCTLLEKLI